VQTTIDPNVPQQTRCINCKTLLAYPPNSLFIQCPKCFTERDTRILTNHGLLYLDDIEKRLTAGGGDDAVLYGCYDVSTREVVYRKGELVFPAVAEHQKLLSFESASGSTLLRVTPDHRMYVQCGDSGSEPYTVQSAASLLGSAPASVRMLTVAEHGHSGFNAAAQQLRVMMDKLSVNHSQYLAFLELLGYWLTTAGSLSYKRSGAPLDAVLFTHSQPATAQWLTQQLQRAGVSYMAMCSGKGAEGVEQLAVFDAAWVELFDDEYGIKYEGSTHYRPDADQHSRPVCPPSPTRSLQRESDDSEEEAEDVLVQAAQLSGKGDEMKAEEDGSIELGVQCDKWLPSWALLQLSTEELQLVVNGLWRASGSFETQQRSIAASTPQLRDQLIQALVHCGLSPHAHLQHSAGSVLGYRWFDECQEDSKLYSTAHVDTLKQQGWDAEMMSAFEPVEAEEDVWAVRCSEANEAAVVSSIVEQCYDAERDGRIWCVTVDHPDHLIIAQHAPRHPPSTSSSSHPATLYLSPPLIVGQCLSTMDPRQSQSFIHNMSGGMGAPGMPGGPLPKLTKKRRDPSAPKAVSNAYMIFCKARRGELKQENPDLPFGKIGAKLGEIWRMMTPEEKKPYEDKASVDRERYRKEMLDYQTGKHSGSSEKKVKGEGGGGGGEEGDEGDEGDEAEEGGEEGGDGDDGGVGSGSGSGIGAAVKNEEGKNGDEEGVKVEDGSSGVPQGGDSAAGGVGGAVAHKREEDEEGDDDDEDDEDDDEGEED